MQIQNFLPFFLLFVILITTFPVSLCKRNDFRIKNCSSLFSCGRSFPHIKYPFWGGNGSCGEGIYLTCREDDYLTIEINPPFLLYANTYRVLNMISNATYFLTLAPNNSAELAVCPEDYGSRSMDGTIFRPTEEIEDVKLYSSCRDAVKGRNQLSCTGRRYGSPPEVIDYSFSDSDCDSFISVPALRSKVYEFTRTDSSMTLRDLVYSGFTVELSLDWVVCSNCSVSQGLCWPGTNLTEPTCRCLDGSRRNSYLCQEEGRGSDTPAKLGIALGTFTICGFAFILIACGRYHGKSSMMLFKRKTKEDQNLEAVITQYGASLAPQRYSYSYIKRMTMSFNDELGQGGYGTVYKGKLSDGCSVAVKILTVSKQNSEEFINEVMSTSRTSHVNVVKLLGFCMEGKKRALVYKYMPNGSLEKYIHYKKTEKTSFNQLEMDKLYQISLGVARGLEYLHRGCDTRIMHFDIKPHNILLDENFRPKISDFGMAKQCRINESMVSIMGARGTIGYIAPELISRTFGVVSYKSDVYSYGMMILEIVGRRKNVSLETSHASEVYFPHWAYQHLVIDNDLSLKDVTPEEDELARKIILVGLWCVQSDPSLRPTMSKAIEMLEGDLNAITMPPKSFFGFPSTPQQTCSIISTTVAPL